MNAHRSPPPTIGLDHTVPTLRGIPAHELPCCPLSLGSKLDIHGELCS